MKLAINVVLLAAQALVYAALAYVVLDEAIDRRQVSILRQTCVSKILAAEPGHRRDIADNMCRNAVK